MSKIKPIHYKIQIKPDLTDFTFSGQIEILLNIPEPVDVVNLDIVEIEILNCEVNTGKDFETCSFAVFPENEEVRVSLPRKMAGEVVLLIDYSGEINDKMVGFYRSGYKQNGDLKYIAVTQFQEKDARRAFPCMDHPGKKAVFEIEMIIDRELSAISNTDIESEAVLENGKKQVRFHKTPIMSTYLVFFGIGEFEFIQDDKDRRMRAVSIPGMIEHTKFGLEFGRKALNYCEEYYKVPYPLSKMDLIAIPDFVFGAMENWGAITFRENLLLHFPGVTSRLGEEKICEVIAHEMAHQWFGNLVTPSEWKYLWLNESFATFFGYGAVDHYYPKWGVWYQFLNEQTNTALVRDGLHETFALELPGGKNVAINSSTAPIIYCKGGSVLRQILGYIGSDNFRNGVSHFLEKHEYSNAASHHLWEAFEAVSKEPVKKLMRSWIDQPGYPIIEVEKKGSTLELSQKKFTYLPNTSGQKWLVPVNIEVFDQENNSKIIKTLLDDKTGQVEIGDDAAAYKINSGQTGFYRVRYRNEDHFKALGEYVFNKKLKPEDRWGLQNDLFALVKSGTVLIDEYLGFLENYKNEDNYLPMISISGNLFNGYLILSDENRKKIALTGKKLLESSLESIGYMPVDGEAHTTAILREQILWHAVVFGSEKAEDFAMDCFKNLLNGDEIHPDILKSVMQTGAFNWSEDTIGWFDRRLMETQIEHERMNILNAMACFKDRSLIEMTLKYIMESVPPRNQFVPIIAMASNPYTVEYMWDWYISELTALEKFHPMLYDRIITGIVPICGIGKADEVNTFFNRYLAEKPKSEEVVKLALEKLNINLKMKIGHEN